jgi:hypothetical protein
VCEAAPVAVTDALWDLPLTGRLEQQWVESQALAGNALGDPSRRPIWVLLPSAYDAEPDRRFPTVYVLQGYTGYLTMWANRSAFREPFLVTADRAINAGTDESPPAIVVFVDAWTTYGGSQFVDSPGTGRYHSYLCDDVVPWVDATYRTLAAPAHRGVQGKSSGGFGAMITPMLRPDLFGALASHAGDALYEQCYLRDFGNIARALRDYDHDIQNWWTEFRGRTSFTKPNDDLLLITLGVAACFSADPDGTVRLPFDQRWLGWDPVRMVPRYADALRGLRGIWLDAGKSDEWFLDLGALAVQRALGEIGVSDVQLELYDGKHGGIDYRYPLSLAWLARTLAP